MERGKIVVGTDFSEPSNLAVAQAMHVARHVGAEVVLVHAGTMAEHQETHFGAHKKEVDGWRKKVFAQNRKELDEFRVRLAGQGVEVSQAFHEGLPATSLCHAATELGADMLVVGSHSFSGITRFLLGNVAERVIKFSEQSVLVARSAGHAGGFRRILVPVDLEEDSDTAIQIALSLASEQCEIELFHCWQLPHGLAESWLPGDSPGLQELRDSIEGQVKDKLRALSLEHSTPEAQVTFEQTNASPREGIVKRLEYVDYDLVVVASQRRSGMDRWLLSSVSEATARHAPCSVLVLKNSP
jgi:nucleotide-binding universal stress UspA family protein